MEALAVDDKWAQKIVYPRESFQFIPLGSGIKELLTFLREDRQPNHLHLVVTAARTRTQDEENKDKVGDIKNTYYSRTDTRFPPSLIHSNSGFY